MSTSSQGESRGRFSLTVQCLFAIALTIAALASVWLVPHFGWQSMFIIGAVPAFLVIPLQTTLPESPRWLASQGRLAEADLALKGIETIAAREKAPCRLAAEPARRERGEARIMDLFQASIFDAPRGLGIWICTYHHLRAHAWAPSLFRTVYKLACRIR